MLYLLPLILAQDVPATRLDWAWLADTWWIVPPADLPAMQLDPKADEVSWIVDQTVWQFQGYKTGYLWGRGVVLLRDADLDNPGPAEPDTRMCLTIFGSITPQGAVHLTFIPTMARDSSRATTGTGRISPFVAREDGQIGTAPSFEMQMSTGDRDRTAHWAHMVQVDKDDPAWSALPGFAMGVEEAMEKCKELKGP